MSSRDPNETELAAIQGLMGTLRSALEKLPPSIVLSTLSSLLVEFMVRYRMQAPDKVQVLMRDFAARFTTLSETGSAEEMAHAAGAMSDIYVGGGRVTVKKTN